MFSKEQLEERFLEFSKVERSPSLHLICVRQQQKDDATKDQLRNAPLHSCPDQVECTITDGLIGDRWQPGDCPGSQVSIVDLRIIKTISETKEDWHKNGDNFICDLELARHVLSVGQQIQIGNQVVLEVNDTDHAGCDRFAARYGKDAVKWINSVEGKKLRRRGIKATVIKGGMVSCGDTIQML